MSSDLVLVTGVSGFVGSKTLLAALKAGYRVRGTVRTSDKAEVIKAHPAFKPYLSQLEFSFIPDLAAPGAYTEAIKGVTYVLHVASPVPAKLQPGDDIHAAMVKPAVDATIGMLEAAAVAGTVKRVVITGSIVSIVPFSSMMTELSTTVYNEKSIAVAPEVDNAWNGYFASKVNAYNGTHTWIKANSPSFDVITVLPGSIIGSELLATSEKSLLMPMNVSALSVLLGIDGLPSFPSNSVAVDDVAELHVRALDYAIAGGQSFIATSDGLTGSTWKAAEDAARKYFPKRIADGTFPLGGAQDGHVVYIDSSNTEKVFKGFKFTPYELQVKQLAEQYLSLIDNKA